MTVAEALTAAVSAVMAREVVDEDARDRLAYLAALAGLVPDLTRREALVAIATAFDTPSPEEGHHA